jgi:CheY-like chemotaxis protein
MVISQSAMGKRILIADDSVTIQKAFAMTLGSEDFAITAARSADEGLTLARQTRPDLVIADASMPGRSGYELCAALKADAALRAVPVYILSSAQQPFDEAKGQQVGAEGTFIKPWDSAAFIEKLKEAAGRPAGASAPRPPAPTPPPARPTSSLPTAALEADFEVEVEAPPRETSPAVPIAPPRATAPVMPLAATMPSAPAAPRPAAPPAAAPPGGMRPSLIPGIRPGAVPPVRPGTSPSRTLGATAPMGSAVPPRPAAGAAPMGRTLFGLPAASMPFPGSTRPAPASVAPAAPAYAPPAPAPAAYAPAPAAPAYAPPAPAAPAYAPPAPVAPAYAPPAPAHEPVAARPAASPALTSSVSSLVDQKVAAISARGPEYEALAKLSREVIEQIVWEIVPELAEAIIREQVGKRGVG